MACRLAIGAIALLWVAIGTAFAGFDEGQAAIARGDYSAAFAVLQPLADQGHAEAQLAIGDMYLNGQGTPRDDKKAVEWFRNAAEQGNARGQANLGFMYGSGRGVAKDDAEAVRWYRRSVEQGDARAQTYLAYMYLHGRGGLPQDDKQAFDLLRKAAEQGDVGGQFNLALMYATGRGVANNHAEAAQWYRKAAEQGNASAQNNLGMMYQHGLGGLPQDDKQAAELYRKAAEQGNAAAQNHLGFMYQYGRGGLSRDDRQAIEWYRKAAEQGDTRAQTALSAIEHSEQELPSLSRTVAELVKANEAAQSVATAVDPERVALAREVIDASGAREMQIDQTEETNERLANLQIPPSISPRFVEAMRITLIASFKRDRILASWERKLAERLDATTLRVGLLWNRSDVGSHMRRLDAESMSPEKRTALNEFARELVSKGAKTDDARARACAQADTLSDKTESLVPMLEAMAAGVMIGAAQKAPAMDMDTIGRAAVAMRPLLREVARQSVLGQCLFAYRDLTDAEVEQWLDFLRSESGGRYARGLNDARRDALLDATEVFTRTLVAVTSQMKGRGDS